MTAPSRALTRWLLVVAFAIAMAWVESACVYYLRLMVDRINPYQHNPLPMNGVLQQVELVREAATLVMLTAVGILAGRTPIERLGYGVIAFGLWDIFYYVFLWLICGWPKTLFDWDILFLLPLPWWGPVLAPMLIALMMVVWGTMVSQGAPTPAARSTTRTAWGVCSAGTALALYVFMADAIHAVPQGFEAAKAVLPTSFSWPPFIVAVVLMAAPIVELAWVGHSRSAVT